MSAGDATARRLGRLDGVELSLAEMRRALEEELPAVRARLAAAPEELGRVVRSELLRRALVAEARRDGWHTRPEIGLRMKRAAEQVLVGLYLREMAKVPSDYPPDAEVREFYEENRAAFVQPPVFRLAQVYFASPLGALGREADAAFARAGETTLMARQAGADFAALARARSERLETAANGGELGWVPEPQIIPEVRAVVANMSPGEVSAPIRSGNGWHVVKLLDRRPGGLWPLEQVRETVVANLRERRARVLEASYLDALAKGDRLEIDGAALEALAATLAAR